MGYETYHIPVNYTDAGKLFGLFEIRNVVEAVLIGLPVLALCARFLPLVITWKITVSLFFLVPTVGFALIGLKDDSLTRYPPAPLPLRRTHLAVGYRGPGAGSL